MVTFCRGPIFGSRNCCDTVIAIAAIRFRLNPPKDRGFPFGAKFSDNLSSARALFYGKKRNWLSSERETRLTSNAKLWRHNIAFIIFFVFVLYELECVLENLHATEKSLCFFFCFMPHTLEKFAIFYLHSGGKNFISPKNVISLSIFK